MNKEDKSEAGAITAPARTAASKDELETAEDAIDAFRAYYQDENGYLIFEIPDWDQNRQNALDDVRRDRDLRRQNAATSQANALPSIARSIVNLDPWPLEYPDGHRARDFEDGVADHLALDGTIYYGSEIGPGLEFKPRLGFEQDRSKYQGV